MQRQMEIRPGAGLDIEGPARAHGGLNPTHDLHGGRHLPVGPSYTALIRSALQRARVPRLGGTLGI
jgi:hypothetical protein